MTPETTAAAQMRTSLAAPDAGRFRSLLWAALAAGLVLRLAVLASTASLGTPIADEQHYARLGANLLAGHGFAMEPGQPTSIRPPLYPAMLAMIWAVAGSGNLQAVRAVQIGLSLVTAWLAYLLGRRLYGPAVGRLGAVVCWLYPSLVFSNSLILTETLFTLLLLAFVVLAVRLVQEPSFAAAAACGAALAAAALTRSVLWPTPFLLCPLLVLLLRAPLGRRLALSATVFAAFAIVLAPWSVRNTRLQGTFTTVDTMGGINLRMGNYEYTPEDRMWDAVSVTGERNWVYALSQDRLPGPITEGVKDKWAQRRAVRYMLANPGTTIRRAIIKFGDFWGLEREFLAGVQQGLFNPPRWFQVAAVVSILAAYVAVVLAGAAGAWVAAPADWRLHVVALFPVVLVTAAHTIVFGHSRYHFPLMPILGVYAAALLCAGRAAWPRVASPSVLGAALTTMVLSAFWVRQVFIVDAGRIAALLRQAGL